MMAEATPPVPEPGENMGKPLPRYEARAKVTGEPLYADDLQLPNPAIALFVTSGIARGRILQIDTAAADALPGVLKIYTHLNAPRREVTKHYTKGGYVSDSAVPLGGPDIVNDGQIVAVVVAEDFATARDAAHRIAIRYEERSPSATFGSAGAATIQPDALAAKSKKAGDFAGAYAAAPVKIDGPGMVERDWSWKAFQDDTNPALKITVKNDITSYA